MKKDIRNSLLCIFGLLALSGVIFYVAEQSVENPVKYKYHEQSDSEYIYTPTWMPVNIGGQTYMMPF